VLVSGARLRRGSVPPARFGIRPVVLDAPGEDAAPGRGGSIEPSDSPASPPRHGDHELEPAQALGERHHLDVHESVLDRGIAIMPSVMCFWPFGQIAQIAPLGTIAL
jgi:hypothetical protein